MAQSDLCPAGPFLHSCSLYRWGRHSSSSWLPTPEYLLGSRPQCCHLPLEPQFGDQVAGVPVIALHRPGA